MSFRALVLVLLGASVVRADDAERLSVLLGSPDAGVRREAVTQLRDVGDTSARVAVPGLIDLLERGENVEAVLEALISIGRAAESALPLIEGLGRPDDERVALALAALSEPSPKTSARYRAALTSANPSVRILAARMAVELARNDHTDLLVERLDDPDPRVRIQTARSLAALTVRTDVALPRLVEALGSDVASERLLALEGLTDLGPLARDAAPHIRTLLGDPEPRVRAAAAGLRFALLALGREGFDALAPRTRDGDAKVRAAALRALFRVGSALPDGHHRVREYLTRGFADAAAEVRLAAVEGWHETEAASPDLRALLADPDATVRSAVLHLFRRNGYPDAIPTALLYARLGDEDAHVRKRARELLDGLPPADDPSVLLGLLRHESPEVRHRAAQELGRLGPAAAVAAPELATLVRQDANWYAAHALVRTGEAGVSHLVDLLRHSRREVVEATVNAIGEAGAEYVAPHAALLRAWAAAALALGRGANMRGVAAALRASGDPEAYVTLLSDALRAQADVGDGAYVGTELAQLGPAGAEALVELLDVDDETTRWAVYNAIHEADPDLAWRAIEPRTRHRDPYVRQAAAHVLSSLSGDPTAEMAERAAELLADPHPGVRRAAAEAAQSLASESDACAEMLLPSFVGALTDRQAEVRHRSTTALRWMRRRLPDAWEAVRVEVEKLARSDAPAVRETAARVLEPLTD